MWIVTFILLAFVNLAQAQEALIVAQTTPPRLEWSYEVAPATCTSTTANTTVRSSVTGTGAFTTVAIVGSTATTYTLPAIANNLYYRVETACGVSNVVQYVALAPTGPTLDQRVVTLETNVAAMSLAITDLRNRVGVLETPVVPPPSTANITATPLDADRIEIRGLNCTSLATTGTGLQRIVTCRH